MSTEQTITYEWRGPIWMPSVECYGRETVTVGDGPFQAHIDVEDIDDVERYLDLHLTGDYASVTDWRAELSTTRITPDVTDEHGVTRRAQYTTSRVLREADDVDALLDAECDANGWDDDDDEPIDAALDPDDIPSDFPVTAYADADDIPSRMVDRGDGPTDESDPVQCGTCELWWDDSIPTTWTPAPSARCPFEYQHRG